MSLSEGMIKCREYSLPIGKKTYIMGILNVTPDSFSDGGRYEGVELAVKRAIQMVEQGADIIDIGGESTRPGHVSIDTEQEISRVLPVVEKLAKVVDVPISVDTSKAAVARAVLKCGAHIINDVWGLQKDSEMAGVIAEFEAGVIVMHNQMDTHYKNLIGDISDFLNKSIKIAEASGIDRASIVADPGIGFGKTYEQNILVIKHLDAFKKLGVPLLLGTSRKSVIGITLDLPVEERIEGTAATVALGIAYGIDIVRVHDIKEMVRVCKMSDAIVR